MGVQVQVKMKLPKRLDMVQLKMNLDTDLQWVFHCRNARLFFKYKDYLKSQIGNPDGKDNPNKNIMIQENG